MISEAIDVSQPYVVIRAPDIVQNHRAWLESQVSGLKNSGYTYFRAGFPDNDQRDLFLEAWIEQPKDLGPTPWEKPDFVPRVRPTVGVRQTSDDICLLDGSAVPADGISYKRKIAGGQQASYTRLNDRLLASKPMIRPHRTQVRHLRCGTVTEMHEKMAMTLSRDPTFYKALFCAHCRGHFSVGKEGEFMWRHSDQRVGT